MKQLTVTAVVQKALAQADSIISDAHCKTAADKSAPHKTELARYIAKLAAALREENAQGVTYDDVNVFAQKIKGSM